MATSECVRDKNREGTAYVFCENAAPGIHRVEESFVNWYLVEGDGRLTVVDAGMPVSRNTLLDVLERLGRSPADIDAIVLTHAHFDHVGFAEAARRDLGVRVWVHEKDRVLSRHPLRYRHERSRLWYALRPATARIMATFISNGMLRVQGVEEVVVFQDGQTLDVPGTPRVVYTPGHTFGHCSLHFPDRDAVIAGDALVTLDPYTARTGPRLVARAATADSQRAWAALGRLYDTGVSTVLPGHGEPWTSGVAEAVRLARAAGIA